MTTAERTATPLLPTLPPRKPGGPGQFAFADADRVRADSRRRWLDGHRDGAHRCGLPLPEAELMGFITRLGPVGMALQEADEATRASVIEAVRSAFDAFVSAAQARFTAACWQVGARA